MVEPIIDDVFTRYERLETTDVARVSEENIGHLARLFKGTVDYGSEPMRLTINVSSLTPRAYELGDWINSQGLTGEDPRFGGWRASGTYVEQGGA